MFFILFCGITCCYAEIVECQFKEDYYWNEEETFYTCQIKKLDIKNDSINISNVSGTHSYGKSNQDIKQLVITKTNTDYLPDGLGKIFNLTSLMVYSTTLKEIHSKNFIGMDELKFLYLAQNQLSFISKDFFLTLTNLEKINLSFNQLEVLEYDLFINNLKLDYIWLHTNKISSIGSDLFKHLIKLKFVDLRNNNCVNIRYSDIEEIDELKNNNQKCKKTFEKHANSQNGK